MLLSQKAHGGLAPGPDSFGYTVVPVSAFPFIQLTNGTASRVLSFNDDAATNANLGFAFNFYGTNYTNVSFNVNGLLMFVAQSEEFSNLDLTSTSPTNNQPAIAVLWDDWETQENWADAIYYGTIGSSPFRRFVMQWNKVVPVNGDGTNTVTFEVVLFETSNRILLSYLDTVVSDETTSVASLGAGATVGIRDRSGQINNRNLQWSYNQPVITNGLALLFSTTNHAPAVVTDPISTLEDTPVTFNPLANDADQDGDSLALKSVAQGTNGVVTANPNGTITYTPNSNYFGVDAFTYVVADILGASATGTVNVAVSAVNDSPMLDTVTDLTLDEDSGTQAINLTGIMSGAPNEADTLTVTTTSSNPALIPAPLVSYVSPNSTGTISFASVTNGFGSATINVAVNDGGGSNNLVTRSFLVTVNPVNDPPRLNPLGDITVNEDPGQIPIFISGISSGATNEPDALTVSATSSDTNVILQPGISYTSPNAFALMTLTPVANAFGIVTIDVTVNDGRASNNVAIRSFTVTINPVNDPPSITPISNQTNYMNQAVGPLPITLSDVETPAADLIVSAASSNPALVPTNGVIITGSGANRTVTVTPLTNQTGLVVITIIVQDADGATDTSVFGVDVAPLPPLHIDLIQQDASGGMVLTFGGVAGHTYAVEACEDLNSWASLGHATEVAPEHFEFRDTTAVALPFRYYRLRQ